jgi:anti-sigma B factor antagonist
VAVRPDSPGDLMPDRTRFDQLVIDVDRRAQDAATVRAHGELDIATVPALQHELEALLGKGVQRLVLDLSGVPFCDVPALNLLVRIQCQLSSRGGYLMVLGACRPLRIMISALGLDGYLPLMLPAAADRARKDGPPAG